MFLKIKTLTKYLRKDLLLKGKDKIMSIENDALKECLLALLKAKIGFLLVNPWGTLM